MRSNENKPSQAALEHPANLPKVETMKPDNRVLIAHHAQRIVDAHRRAVRHETTAERVHGCAAKQRHVALAAAYHTAADNALTDIMQLAATGQA